MTGQTPWPTFEQYMSLERASHLSHHELVGYWTEQAGRSSSGYKRELTLMQSRWVIDPDHDGPFSDEYKHQLLDQTLADIERDRFKRPAVRQIFYKGLTVTHEPTDPKGPIALRLRLWWMRVQLRWMLLRLDGAPISINKTLREYA